MKTSVLVRITLITTPLLLCCPAIAQDTPQPAATVWDGPAGRPGSWFLQYNWSAGVPTAASQACIRRDTAVIHGFNADSSVLAAAENLYIGSLTGAELEILTGGLSVGEEINLGYTYPLDYASDLAPWPYQYGNGRITMKSGSLSAETVNIYSSAISPLASAVIQPGSTIVQSGGEFRTSGALNVGFGQQIYILANQTDAASGSDDILPDSRSNYYLSGGTAQAALLNIGRYGDGRMVQSAGEVHVTKNFIVCSQWGWNIYLESIDLTANYLPCGGEYLLKDGYAKSPRIGVADTGIGRVLQSGGSLDSRMLAIASPWHYYTDYESMANPNAAPLVWIPPKGLYCISDGQLTCNSVFIGQGGRGSLYQSGGTVKVSEWLVLGDDYTDAIQPALSGYQGSDSTEIWTGNTASCVINGGQLSASTIFLGGGPDVALRQEAGQTSAQTIRLLGSNASYTLSGGTMNAGLLAVGSQSQSTTPTNVPPNRLQLHSSRGLTVSDCLDLGVNAGLFADNYCAIQMHGSDLLIRGIDSGALSGLDSCRLYFTPGDTDFKTWQLLEAAGEDRGFTRAGFWDNFVIDTLVLDGACRLALTDRFDNQPQSQLPEAVYVRKLVIGEGSVLNLGGLNIYYLNGDIRGRIINTEDGEEVPVLPSDGIPLLPGDINLDGVVNLDDFIVLKDNYGASDEVHWSRGDMDGDGQVGLNDFIILKSNYGNTE